MQQSPCSSPGREVSMRPQTSRTVSFLAATARALNCAHVGSGSAAPPRSTAGWSAVTGPYLACAAQESRALSTISCGPDTRTCYHSSFVCESGMESSMAKTKKGAEVAALVSASAGRVCGARLQALCHVRVQPEGGARGVGAQHLEAVDDLRLVPGRAHDLQVHLQRSQGMRVQRDILHAASFNCSSLDPSPTQLLTAPNRRAFN